MTRLERAQQRAAALLLRWEAGESQGTIAKELGISRQRVNQIIGYARMQRDMAMAAEPYAIRRKDGSIWGYGMQADLAPEANDANASAATARSED